jgi:hypothetical protein
MSQLQLARRGLAMVVLAGALAACASETTAPSGLLEQATLATATVTTLAATLRVRCEARRNSRSKISVDGNNLSPRNGSFRARVRAAGGTVTSAARRAVGDEGEFDFDSDRGDIAQGATRIPARFIVARSGRDWRAAQRARPGHCQSGRGLPIPLTGRVWLVGSWLSSGCDPRAGHPLPRTLGIILGESVVLQDMMDHRCQHYAGDNQDHQASH